MPEVILVTPFTPEDGPFLEKVHLVILAMSADFDFRVLLKLVFLLEAQQRLAVLLLVSLGIDHFLVPFNNLFG